MRMMASYNLTMNKTIEIKTKQATNQSDSDTDLIKMVLTPMKEGNQTITI